LRYARELAEYQAKLAAREARVASTAGAALLDCSIMTAAPPGKVGR
jgi:hypothetical protein